jgi:DNA-binding response OmpR family regulator
MPQPNARASTPAQAGTQARVLVVEPDHLTLWSVATYLQRWFTVDTTNCGVEAEKLLRDHVFAALVVSDQLPRRTAETLVALARNNNPNGRAVLMVSSAANAESTPSCATRIEKPFELATLARLLGIGQI